ncbi:MAG TPA: histidine kinase [Gemmatimonadales bacterium]|jgi:signal transduction histidine kinase|nr:histidine kinase [Gemmatimonadales bacterium]
MPPHAVLIELQAAFLQATITVGLAVLCSVLYFRFHKPYFLWWSLAWTLYVLRLGAIIVFLITTAKVWLFWHQIITGWTALTLLWASLVFSRRLRWRWGYGLLALFPLVWSYFAIYVLDDFLLAAGPAVAFLSLATLWTGVTFARDWRKTGARGSAHLAVAFLLWGLHHLDYPLLRARGAWSPWGYYLDILFELAVGAGIVLLVLEDLQRGVGALAALSGDIQSGGQSSDGLGALLERPLRLRGVRGSAMYLRKGATGTFVRGVGTCTDWAGREPQGETARLIAQALDSARPVFSSTQGFVAVLPVFGRGVSTGALVMVGDARDPFTALDESFLIALGQQVGAALETADLNARLKARTSELELVSTQMVRHDEALRRRLSLELHDETAQVFSAVKMQLGVLREQADPSLSERFDRALELVDTGMQSIRDVTNDLRPAHLDDLGLVPALRALVTEFGERTGLQVTFVAAEDLPELSEEAELALFRALQEGLSNVLKHAGAKSVAVGIGFEDDGIILRLSDDGRGLGRGFDLARLEREGHLGLAGMRERVQALGGWLEIGGRPAGGTGLRIWIPAQSEAA